MVRRRRQRQPLRRTRKPKPRRLPPASGRRCNRSWRRPKARRRPTARRQRAGARRPRTQLALDDPDNADAKRAAEKHLAEEALDYWRTVERLGETETERSLAAQNADAAEKALTYWNDESRGWLSRLFGGR